MIAKILGIVCLFVGESIAIYAEVVAAKTYGAEAPFLAIFLKMFLVIIVSGAFLIAGYMLGFRGFRDIWIVSVASVASILIMEPVVNLAVFRVGPTPGAIVGLVLGAAGLVAAASF